MYSHAVITAVAFAILTANLCIAGASTEAFVEQNVDGKVYDVLYDMSENVSAIMLDPVSRQAVNVVRENAEYIANDPLSHNAIVDLLEVANIILTDPNASQAAFNALAVVQKLASNAEFQNMIAVFGKGVVDIMSMRNIGPVADVILRHMESILSNPNFANEFPVFMQNMTGMLNMGRNFGRGSATAIANGINGINGRAAAVANGLSSGLKRMAAFRRFRGGN